MTITLALMHGLSTLVPLSLENFTVLRFPFDFTRRRYDSRRCLTGSLATDTTLPVAASSGRIIVAGA